MKKKKKNLKEKNVKNLKKKYLTQYKKFLTELGRVWFFFAPASKNKKMTTLGHFLDCQSRDKWEITRSRNVEADRLMCLLHSVNYGERMAGNARENFEIRAP